MGREDLEVGGGANIFLNRPEQEDEQRLREVDPDERGVHLRSDEPSDGREIGPLVRLFRRSQKERSPK